MPLLMKYAHYLCKTFENPLYHWWVALLSLKPIKLYFTF